MLKQYVSLWSDVIEHKDWVFLLSPKRSTTLASSTLLDRIFSLFGALTSYQKGHCSHKVAMASTNEVNGHFNGISPGKPTILVVTGAWHVPQHYTLVTDGLRSQGFNVSDPCLPSCSNQTPLADLDDDIAFIRRHAHKFIDEGEDLLVLMHSYGGVVGSYAFANFPTPATRQWSPTTGRLVSLMYMTGFVPLAGESLTAIFGGGLPPFLPLDKEAGDIILSKEVAKKHFYQDCTEKQQHQAIALFMRHGIDAQFQPPRREAVLADLNSAGPKPLEELRMAYSQDEVKVGYLYCDKDAGLPLALQEMMVGRVKKLGVKVEEWHTSAGHSPFVSKAEAVVVAVKEMASRLGS